MHKISRADLQLQSVVPFHGNENCLVCCLVKAPEYSVQVRGHNHGYICSQHCVTWMDEKQHIQDRVLKGIEFAIAAEAKKAIPPAEKKAAAIKKLQEITGSKKIAAKKKTPSKKPVQKTAAANADKDGTKTRTRHGKE